MAEITPVLTNAANIREKLHEKTIGALQKTFPLQLKGRTLELADVRVHSPGFGPRDEYNALTKGSSLNETVKGTLILKDEQGKVLDTANNFTLVHVPYLTDRHTLIAEGNEYQIANQLRRKPGVYTQRSDNGELKTVFNLGRGKNFDLKFNADKGTFHMAYGTSNIPLYAVLRGLGVSHDEIASHIGEGVAKQNEKEAGKKVDISINKLYSKIEHPALVDSKATAEQKVQAVQRKFEQSTLDSDVTKETLGHAYDRVTPAALMVAAKKMLDVHNGVKQVDDTDSLKFKTFHSMDDFIAERVALTARKWAPKAKMAFSGKTKIRDALSPAPFSDSVRKFLTESSLASVPTGINPMEILDHAVKVTSLGEGGIPSDRAIPFDARMIHNTHFGALDPIRTPESGHSGVDIRATNIAHRDDKGNLYTLFRNVKTDKPEYVKAGDLSKHVVAFAHQPLTGKVDAFVNGEYQKVNADQVTHQMMHVANTYSPATTLIPMIHSIQGNRAIMGSKMGTQALPLIHREPPLVQVRSDHPDGHSFETLYGHVITPVAPVRGTVDHIDDEYVYIRPHSEKRAADRPVVQRRELGPHTFNIEIPRHTSRFDVPTDYGHLPGYTGPDGDSLDFYVDDHPDGVISAYHKMERLNDKGERDPSVPWAAKDVKFVVGHTPEEAKAFHEFLQKTWSTPTLRYDHVQDFPDWESLNEHINQHYKTAADKLVKVPYFKKFPFPSKTFLDHQIDVKPGDKVEEGQRLGDSNYTKNGVLSLGMNLRVGYMPYYGFNSNDAVVISQACAEKLTSEHMYRETFTKPANVEMNKSKHQMYYGTKYPISSYNKLDANGVIKKGAKVDPKDLLVAALVKQSVSGTDVMLGRMSKSLTRPFKDLNMTWEHSVPGEVIDVIESSGQITILIQTRESMQVGDKLAGRYGNKGVVAKIVPNHEMLRDEEGHPIDLLLTSAGVVSRINPAQVIETAVSKVAKKTGQPIVYDNAAGHNAVKWARDLMKEHGVKDKEELYDPVLQRSIKGPDGKGVLVGHQYIYKLFKSTDTNFAGHGVGPYDLNEQPLKTGGDESAKGLGKMEFDALLAHNARNVLREAATIRGQKNDEFWKAVQLGLPLPQPKPSFAFNKFVGMLEGAGVRVDKRGSKLTLLPMTDKDVLARSTGAIQTKETVRAKDMRPEKGGLFDPRLTGGTNGTLYSHIDLHESVPNPVFEEPMRRLLGLTENEFREKVREHGGEWFKSQLNGINVDQKITELRGKLNTAKGPVLNDYVKQIKYLEALKKHDLKPGDAYVISKIPVIPPAFRPIQAGIHDPSQLMVADANKLYGQLMDSNSVLKNTALKADTGKHREDLYEKVEELYGTTLPRDPKMQQQKVKGMLATIAGVGSPKGGFFQRKLMRHTQDVSGRGTAVPDSNLNMDQVGLPEPMLWLSLDKLIVARLIRTGYSALQAREMVNNKTPAAREALLAELRERPAFINRAPTLHRGSIVAAYVTPVQGKTIRVSAFAEKGMNLDYDGDTLQVHFPVTQAGIEDAKKMTLSNMLMSDQQRNRLMVFPQHEAIIATTLAAKNTTATGPVRKFKSREDALAAYRRGELKLSDAIEVENTKLAAQLYEDMYAEPDMDVPFIPYTGEEVLSLFPPESVLGEGEAKTHALQPR